MQLDHDEIIETRRMIREQSLDIRTVTMGISILDCVSEDPDKFCRNLSEKLLSKAKNVNSVCDDIQAEYGISIVNRRISITPIALVTAGPQYTEDSYVKIAKTLDDVGKELNINFIGGFGGFIQKGFTNSDSRLISVLPRVLSETKRVCSFFNVASTKTGINMDGIGLISKMLKETSKRTAAESGLGCAKFVAFANSVDDSPFMAGAYHGAGEPENEINVGISGPGVIKSAIEQHEHSSFVDLADIIKKFTFKITRLGQLIANIASERLNVSRGIVDLSLAPTSKVGDSVAEILQEMGLEYVGGPGSTAALAMLNDAIKRGGLMATANTGGLSGSFIPVMEDFGLANAVEKGKLNLEKLESMTTVCSVGLDMVPIPGDTSESTIAGIIADEMAIGVWNQKTTGVRLILVPGAKPGDTVSFGGLFGEGPVMRVSDVDCSKFVNRSGHIPGPITGFRN